MKLLYAYLRQYTGLVALALVLATINQVFSLLDPLIFRHVIDQYATRFQEYTTAQFFKGVSLLLGAAVGVAFAARSSIRTASAIRWSCPTPCSRISAAARRSAGCRRSAPTSRS
jgi:ABC-type multidrug transport system fused ATPase/permease subunit